mmetsp:Transcript_29358/g.33645  ORF Transcript_29358/g.33645 Transcript_29358/m.33645 type:complete len:124 (+) Transcript_29358:169-540(+)
MKHKGCIKDEDAELFQNDTWNLQAGQREIKAKVKLVKDTRFKGSSADYGTNRVDFNNKKLSIQESLPRKLSDLSYQSKTADRFGKSSSCTMVMEIKCMLKRLSVIRSIDEMAEKKLQNNPHDE